MTANLKSLLAEVEDEINCTNEQTLVDAADSEEAPLLCIDILEEEINANEMLGLKNEFKLDSSEETEINEEKIDITVEEVKEETHKAQSGLFYKVNNHFNLTSLTSHFRQWKEEEKKVFSFHSFVRMEDAFSCMLSLSSFFEHKDNSKVLIISEFFDLDKRIGQELIRIDKKISSLEEDIQMFKLGSCLYFSNLFSLSSSLEEVKGKVEKSFDELIDEFDYVLLLFPANFITEKQNDTYKGIAMKCSNVNYLVGKNGTSLKQIERARDFYKKSGLVEGGVIMEE